MYPLVMHEVTVLVLQIKDTMKKSTPEAIKELQKELQDWESELKRLQELAVLSASRTNLQTVELPALEKQIKAKEAEIPALLADADEVWLRHLLSSIERADLWHVGSDRHRRSLRKLSGN